MKRPFLVLFLLGTTAVHAQTLRWSGQFSTWVGAPFSALDKPTAGLRYLPEFEAERNLGGARLDGLASFNGYATAQRSEGEWDGENRLKPYRLWVRLSDAQNELRLGLQKINFGSASLIRPLMWFDRVDPRDPLQLTDGVWALLYRRYFLNNANLWLWALYGNDDTKGWEVLPTAEKRPEWGGRAQVTVPRGELAVTAHMRQADLDRGVNALLEGMGLHLPDGFDVPKLGQVRESRFAMDGKWDLTLGLWAEAAWTHLDTDLLPAPWQRLITLGADYTFGLGNGLHLLAEHAHVAMTQDALSSAVEGGAFTALALDYPLGLMDSVTGLFFRDWENRQWYRFVRWQRSYDTIQIHGLVFWNPDQMAGLPQWGGARTLAGKGFQLLFVYNH